MSRCVAARFLSRYLDGELPRWASRRLGEHLARCPECARAFDEMQEMQGVIRKARVRSIEVPDVASRVVAELGARGAFFAARMAACKRCLVGDRLLSGRMMAAISVAASLVVLGLVGLDWATRDVWTRQTAPLMADAERILVRLVYVAPPQEAERLAWAREEVQKLDICDRLAEAKAHAEPAQADELAYLQTTFALLAEGRPLPESLHAQLSEGEALHRAARLRESLKPHG